MVLAVFSSWPILPNLRRRAVAFGSALRVAVVVVAPFLVLDDGDVLDLPAPARDRLPTFESLKRGTRKYGSGGRHKSAEEKQARAGAFFRRGVAGSYRDEMPRLVRGLFWLGNHRQMKALGYY